MAFLFALIGGAFLLYFYLPIGNDFTYFWGFFAMALILVLVGILAGLIAAKVLKRGAPPVPTMAIDEARKIRETVEAPAPAPAFAAPTSAAPASAASVAPVAPETTAPVAATPGGEG